MSLEFNRMPAEHLSNKDELEEDIFQALDYCNFLIRGYSHFNKRYMAQEVLNKKEFLLENCRLTNPCKCLRKGLKTITNRKTTKPTSNGLKGCMITPAIKLIPDTIKAYPPTTITIRTLFTIARLSKYSLLVRRPRMITNPTIIGKMITGRRNINI